MDNNTIETKMEGKTCSKCGEFKKFTEFYKRKEMKDGHRSECKLCQSEHEKKKYIKRGRVVRTEEGKVCRVCKEIKYLDGFPKSKREPDGHSYECKECQNNRTRLYYEKNKVKVIKRTGEYGKEHPEMRKKAQKKFQNTERYKTYQSNWRQENVQKAREYVRRYSKTERGREADFKQKMKRRSYKLKLHFTPIERKKLLERDNWKCQNCGCKVHDRHTGNWNTPDKAHIDHVVPVSKGGESIPKNLQVLCRTCNLSKQDKIEMQLSFF